jgi:hypothetical protein
MGVGSFILKLLAKQQYKKSVSMQGSAIENQNSILKTIIKRGRGSLFTSRLDLANTATYNQFKNSVQITDYESIRAYITKISNGEKNILTRGAPKYFAITSGTTSGTKYIPITGEMMMIQTQAIKELLLLYAYQSGSYSISNMGMMFIQGSPELKYFNKMPYAKLSGIAARHIPFFLKKNRYPSMKTNCISDWNKKIKKIVEETYNKDMRVLGGIPPWVITYFEELLNYTNKKIVTEVFPNLKLYIHGGTSFDNYKRSFLGFCGEVDTLEVYPASEGFFAYQNTLNERGLLLLTNHGVFYEFIKLEDYKLKCFNRLCLEDVEVGTDYVMLVSTLAGLWAYNTGDTVRFISKKPYKILFSGRASQYCSAFGEHVIEKEVQIALMNTVDLAGGSVVEFSVCPKILERPDLSHHLWFIEFLKKPKSLILFEKLLNQEMEKQNIYYKDLIGSSVIGALKVLCVKKGGFNEYMKSIGKFGGQNKCPHLSNNTQIGDFLTNGYVED